MSVDNSINWRRNPNDSLKALTDAERAQLEAYAKALRDVTARRGEMRIRRSTLSESNTLQMLPYVKHAAEKMEDFEIPCFAGVRPSTMYLKWQGALQYLIEDHLRDQVLQKVGSLIKALTIAKADKSRGCLVIRFKVADPTLYKDGIVQPRPAGADAPKIEPGDKTIRTPLIKYAERVVAEARATTADWKTDLIDWIQSGDPDEPFIRKGLILSEDDIAFARGIAAENDWVCEVTGTQIKMVKQ